MYPVLAVANRIYVSNYQAHPLLTLASINAVLAGLADTLAQSITLYRSREVKSERHNVFVDSYERERPNNDEMSIGNVRIPLDATNRSFDPYRLMRLSTYGFAIAPIIQQWFLVLDRRFPIPTQNIGLTSTIKHTMSAVAKRVVVDQICFAPFGLAFFFCAMGAMEGHSVDKIKEKFRVSFVPALKANYCVWPLVQVVNFRFMPLRYRVPFTGVMGVLWTGYLSLLNSTTSVH
ncbi:6685_t:CDS:1 [Paraglomus brasilianum]|uniref:6685_t:CDS:1 n=1 Tax=Paraglomus brasilianum TaxID=144538 RepID=A0A9N9AUG8_9GLOM|nr:6685_t:CDS:1 [Paraglomus brasilianum]